MSQGGRRVFKAPFVYTLGAGQLLTVTVKSLESGGVMFNGGFAGYRLIAGGTKRSFFGNAGNGTVWSLAGSSGGIAPLALILDSTETRVATYTYNFDTGAATLSLSGVAQVAATVFASGSAINSIQIKNDKSLSHHALC